MIAPIRWRGGKGKMLEKLLPLIPTAPVYVEPFGGSAGVMLNRPPCPVEVFNDLDGDLVNLFRHIQDPAKCEALSKRIEATLYSRSEYSKSLEILKSSTDPMLRAWAFYVRQNQGFSGEVISTGPGSWGRGFTASNGLSDVVSRWTARLPLFKMWHDRFMRVQIDSVDVLTCIEYWDSEDTLFYLDPPYVHSTRGDTHRNTYAHEMDDEAHAMLVERILSVKGGVVLSCYDHPIYEPLTMAGWWRIDFDTVAHSAGKIRGSKLQGAGSAEKSVPRIETVFKSPNCRRFEGDHFFL